MRIKYFILLIVAIINIFQSHVWGNEKLDLSNPQQVSENAVIELNKSLNEGDGQGLVDALVKYSIAESNIPESNIVDIINRVVSYAEKDSRPDIKALLYHLSAKILSTYKLKKSSLHIFSGPNFFPLQSGVKKSGIKTYSSTQEDSLIKEYVKLSLVNEEELLTKPLTNYTKIINVGSDICPSLYHFLALEGYNLVTHDEELLKHLLDKCEQGSAFHMQVILRTASMFSADMYAKLLDRPYIREEWGICLGYYEKFEDNENCGAFLGKLMMGLGSFYLGEEYLSRFPNSIYAPAIANRVNRIKRETFSVYSNNEYYSNDSLLVELEGFHVDDVVLRLYRLKDFYNVNRLGLYKLSDFTFVEEIKDKMNNEFNHIKNIAFAPQEIGRYIILPSFLSKDGEWVNPGMEFKCPSLIEVIDKTRPSGEVMFNNHEYFFVLRSSLPEPKKETPIILPSLNTYGDLWFSNGGSETDFTQLSDPVQGYVFDRNVDGWIVNSCPGYISYSFVDSCGDLESIMKRRRSKYTTLKSPWEKDPRDYGVHGKFKLNGNNANKKQAPEPSIIGCPSVYDKK